ncbi:hypothetical protein [Aquisalimonas sp.]|uniref:hypothetical protein n=1 Tax=Aquisalimonas sp. TaxID=1872621 RepID=UPI0025B93C46|nr:hypothetical protein [Aquisalimonas sp.]
MPEVQPPAFLQSEEYDALATRRAITANVREGGIIQTGDLGVSPTSPASMTVRVGGGANGGAAMVPGTQVDRQGFYHVVAQGPTEVTLPPANSTNPRIDLVVCRVYDSEYAGSGDEWKLEVVQGTPSSNPAEPNLPPNSLALVAITVPAGASTITSGNISNRRRFASFASERYAIRVPHRVAGVVGTPPNTLYGFLTVAGTTLVTTNGAGEVDVSYPPPAADIAHELPELFPNGVQTVVASPGFASPPFIVNINHAGHTRTTFLARCYHLDGTRLSNTQVRINYVAVGW